MVHDKIDARENLDLAPEAGRSGARTAVLLGLDELPPQQARVRVMDGGGEQDVPVADLAARLRALVAGET